MFLIILILIFVLSVLFFAVSLFNCQFKMMCEKYIFENSSLSAIITILQLSDIL